MKSFVLSLLILAAGASIVEAGPFRRAAHGVRKAASKVVPNRCCGKNCRCN